MMNRDEYVQKLKSQLDEWNAEVRKWEEKTKGAQADARVQYEKQLEIFKQQRDQGMEQMRQLQAASTDAWQAFTRGADDAWAKMRETFEKASSQFGK